MDDWRDIFRDPEDRRLWGRAAFPTYWHEGMMLAMAAAAMGTHRSVNVGAVVFDRNKGHFYGPARNTLNPGVGKAHADMMDGPLDKIHTRCAELNALDYAGGGDFWAKNPRQMDMYSTRICCTRCRDAVIAAKPFSLVLLRETMLSLMQRRPDKVGEINATARLFQSHGVQVSMISVPQEMLGQFTDRLLREFPPSVGYDRDR